MAAYGLSTPPSVDVESCGAAGLGSKQEGRWMARFGLANRQDVGPYKSATVRDFTLGGDDARPVPVSLSKEPWPVK
jgi:hypothetical protein